MVKHPDLAALELRERALVESLNYPTSDVHRHSAELQLTIIQSAKAIVEAIWQARY